MRGSNVKTGIRVEKGKGSRGNLWVIWHFVPSTSLKVAGGALGARGVTDPRWTPRSWRTCWELGWNRWWGDPGTRHQSTKWLKMAVKMWSHVEFSRDNFVPTGNMLGTSGKFFAKMSRSSIFSISFYDFKASEMFRSACKSGLAMATEVMHETGHILGLRCHWIHWLDSVVGSSQMSPW